MKKILTPIITIIFSIGFASNAMAQNILKPQPKEEVTANLMFSPFIKIFGCVLKINETFIHLKDITSYTITPVDKHDVRGKLSIATYGNTINAKSTVNNLNEFNRLFVPYWNNCKYSNPYANEEINHKKPRSNRDYNSY